MATQKRVYAEYSGLVIGEYRLDSLQQEQPHKVTFLAAHRHTQRAALCHFFPLPAGLSAPERLIRIGHLQQEISRLANVKQNALLPILDYGNYEGTPYSIHQSMAPTYALARMLQKRGRLVPDLAGQVLDHVAEALGYAHVHAILHGNLNLHNIFVTEQVQMRQTEIRVAETGLLRIQHIAAHGTTQEQLPLPDAEETCSPEQYLGKITDTTTDVYALGAILYHMLTGHPVFTAAQGEDLKQKHLHAQIPSVTLWNATLPTTLDQIIATALAKNPVQRYSGPADLADAYHQIMFPSYITRKPLVQQPLRPILPAKNARIRQSSRTLERTLSRRQTIRLITAIGAVTVVAGTASVIWANNLQRGATAENTHSPTTIATGSTAESTIRAEGTPATGKAIARVAEVPKNSARTFPHAQSSNPGILVHLTDDRFVAFDSTCTHAGCAVNYNAETRLLECPCHGATFDPAKNAAVVQAPATSALAPIAIRVGADGLITTK